LSFLSHDPANATEHVVPITRLGVQSLLGLDDLRMSAGRNGELWMLHQAVFNARMTALKEMTGQGVRPIRPPTVRVSIQIQVDTVPDTTPDVGMLPEDEHEVRFFTWP
jgi:hypothetical protein